MNLKEHYRDHRTRIKKLYFTVFLFLFLVVPRYYTYSRYNDSKGANGKIGIALWDVSIDTTISSDTMNVVSGNGTQSYSFKVESQSEVATQYTIEISNIPNDIEVSLDGGSYQTPYNNKVVFANAGSFAVNQANAENTHTLTIRAPIDTSSASVSQASIQVKFSQVI